MTSINHHHHQPRFGRYQVNKNGAELYLPGHYNAKSVAAEVLLPGKQHPQSIPMERQGDYWVTQTKVGEQPESIPLGSDYRFRVTQTEQADGKPNTELNLITWTKDGHSIRQTLKQKNDVWTFDNPFPTEKETYFRLSTQNNSKMRLERLDKGKAPVPVPVTLDKGDWLYSEDGGSNTSQYRFSPELEHSEVSHHNTYGSFNRISPYERNTPQKSPVIADITMDCLVTPERLKKLEETERQKTSGYEKEAPNYPHVPKLPMRNPFNRFAFGPKGGHEDGLLTILDDLHQNGISGLLFKPFIGGDSLSSHGYWTEDPFVLNPTFQSKDSLREFIGKSGQRGMKIYADGAFVNQGLNGVQMSANRMHGYKSPYWRWFKQGDENQKGGPAIFPNLTHSKLVYGILPTKTNEKTGLPELNRDRIGIRVINDPRNNSSTYDSKRPTEIELYDPQLENENGTPKQNANPPMLDSSSSVQKYRFQVNPDELKSKKPIQNSKHPNDNLLEWNNFRLGTPDEDNSGVKWDGQINTAMLNTKNPEVVNYLNDAVGYWSRFVMNTHVRNVTQALNNSDVMKQSGHKNLSTDELAQMVKSITQTNDSELNSALEPFDKSKAKPLPKVIDPSIDELDPQELKQIYEKVAPDHEAAHNGKAFAKHLLKEVPMNVLPLPTMFKADLSYPALSDILSSGGKGKFANFMSNTVLGNLSQIPLLGHVFRIVRNVIYPRPFQLELGQKMQDVFSQLDANTQSKLRYGNIQSLLADKVGEVLYLSLLTGKQPNEVRAIINDPKALENAFYQGMPEHILKADPVAASKFIPALLKDRLKNLSSRQMGNLVEEEVHSLDPKLAAVAHAVLNQREAGLNWRIDAARDVADMNRVLETDNPKERAKVCEEEFDSMRRFWDKLTGSMREVFPKASIIPELTDIELLAGKGNEHVAQKIMKKMFEKNTFSGMPNMSYLYSPLMQMTHYPQRPDEFGLKQMGAKAFMHNIQRMSEAVPAPVLRQFQNMTSSHDYPTSSHTMLVNPALFTMDLLKHWGLKDDLGVAMDELEHKPCFANQRSSLGIANLKGSLEKLGKLMNDPTVKDRLNDLDLKNFYDKASKSRSEATTCPTPFPLKGKFVDDLFAALKPEELGLQTPAQKNALQQALKARITEPSETKGMRGAIVNAALNLKTSDAAAIQKALWPALDKAAQQWGQHFGYQPLDMALNHVFEQIDVSKLPTKYQGPKVPKLVKTHQNPDGFIVYQDSKELEALKLSLYQTASQPVMNKLQRLFALQTASEGTPSINLQDLFVMYGSEWTKNIMLQNRNPIRVDKLKGETQDPAFMAFFGDVGKLFRARSNPELQALSNGHVLPVTPDEQFGVVPIVRDNGKQQVITLVNTGVQQELNYEHKAGQGAQYEMPERTLMDLRKYQPNLVELGLDPATTQYRDVNTNELFVLNQAGRLHPKGKPSQGVSINNWRMLVRENTTGLRPAAAIAMKDPQKASEIKTGFLGGWFGS